MEPIKKFPQDKEYELKLINNSDDFKSLKEYLSEFIDLAFKKANLNDTQKQNVIKLRLWNNLPNIIEQYKKSGGPDKDYKFSSFFSWHLSQEIDK